MDTRKYSVTRRAALGRIAAGLAASFPVARKARAEDGNPQGLPPVDLKAPEVRQVTTEESAHSNIYCEIPYASRDSRYFLYARQNPKLSRNLTELMVVELGTWKQHLLDVSTGIGASAISHDGAFYYLKESGEKDLDLLRADIGEGKPARVYRREKGPWIRSLGTISPDRRYYAGGIHLGKDYSEFGILLVDLEKGTETVIDRDPYILNPHPQFDPGPGSRLMIQHNRGGRYSRDGKLERLVGPEGATLYVLSVPEGKRTELRVGTPHTTACTGHEAWIGTTGSMLLSVSASGEFAPEKGNLLAVRPGEVATVAAKGYRFNHVGVSRCGKFFTCDDWQPPYKIVVGSIATGRAAVLCESRTSPTSDQATHPHAYLMPDKKWVIFNSSRSGFPHIYAARVPDGLLDVLSRTA